MSEQVRFRRSPTVLARAVGDRVILARTDEDGFEALDGPGALVWELLGEAVTIADLTAALETSFEAPSDVIAQDVEALLSDLEARGLVKRAEDARA